MWLYVTRCNNQPNNVAVDLVTDLSIENGIIAAIQYFFRYDPDTRRYVPTPLTQRFVGLLQQV